MVAEMNWIYLVGMVVLGSLFFLMLKRRKRFFSPLSNCMVNLPLQLLE